MRTPNLLLTLALAALAMSGCAVQAQGAPEGPGTSSMGRPSGQMTMPDGTVMSSSQMNLSATRNPSSAARMICNLQTRAAVGRNLRMAHAASASHTWADRVFTCTYRLPGGDLVLSVYDATDASAGWSHFRRLRARTPGATTIRGLANLGFEAIENRAGDVAFIKDGKTLLVDATGVPAAALPAGFSRQDVAYGVASAVIGCWSG